jgi:hypothetical protein
MSLISIIARVLPKGRIKTELHWTDEQHEDLRDTCNKKQARQYRLELAQGFLALRRREVLKGFVPTKWWETDVRKTIINYRKEVGIDEGSILGST